MLDELDFKILRRLIGSPANRWNARPSYSAVARKVGVDAETVRLRIIRIREEGVMPSWRLLVNPVLLGCREARVETAVTDETGKADAIGSLRALDGVYSIIDFRGPEVAVLFYYNSDADLAKVQRSIEQRCGASSSTVWQQPVTPSVFKMRTLDWGIVAAMQEDAWRDPKDVAQELGVSARTVQRRLVALQKGKAVWLWMGADVKAVAGLACHFIVTFSDAAKKWAADPIIRKAVPKIGAVDATPDKMSLYGVLCSNFHEADAIVAILRGLPGVESVHMRLPKEYIPVDRWLAVAVGRRVQSDV